MNEIQQLLFQNAPECITEAINQLNENTILLPNHMDFVRQLGTRMTTLPPGSVILAAIPCASAVDEVCDQLRQHLDSAYTAGNGFGSNALAMMSVPTAIGQRAQQRALLDTYRNIPRFSDNRRHANQQLTLEFDWRLAACSAFQVTSTILSQRVSTSYYLLRNAHYLQRPSASFSEGAEQLRFVLQMAAESRRTHVLMGNAEVLFQWLGNSEIADAVSLCALEPYPFVDYVSGTSSAAEVKTFASLLSTYEDILPWEGPAPLVANYKAIHEAVAGCPFRLRKWLHDALITAKANGAPCLSWKLVSDRRPLAIEQRTATEDYNRFRSLRTMLHRPQPTERGAIAPRRRFPRSLKRNPVGLSAA